MPDVGASELAKDYAQAGSFSQLLAAATNDARNTLGIALTFAAVIEDELENAAVLDQQEIKSYVSAMIERIEQAFVVLDAAIEAEKMTSNKSK